MASEGHVAVPLKEVFENFKQSKELLQRIHEDTVKCFNNIARELSHPRDTEIAVELSYVSSGSPPASPDEVKVMAQTAAIADVRLDFDHSLAEELYTLQEREEVNSLFKQEPALIVVGQTNCGKSSIINELLGIKALPTSDRPSTARIVHVTYAEKPFCHLVDKNGHILEDIPLKGNKVPRKKIELKKKDRENPDKVEATVVTGLDNEFLKAGVTIIDSPGRNENDALDKLVQEKLKNPLAFVIYVVDGHNLFTKQDRDVLSEIKSRRQELDLFYVVSKLEPEDREASDDDEATRVNEEHSVQFRKKERVYDRLVKNGFLSTESGKSMDENDRFHGLSAWKISLYQDRKRKNPEWDDPDGSFADYIKAFDRFQNSVKMFAEDCLRARVGKVCQVLIGVLSRCLDFFIQKANVLKQGKQTTMKLLETLRHEEEVVHGNIKRSLEEKSSDIKDVLFETFEGAREGILKEARVFEYVLAELTIPKDGFVSNKEAVGQCKDQLQRMVVNKLQGQIKQQLILMFHSRDQFLTQMKERIKQIEEETAAEGGVPAAAVALTRSLLSTYEANIPVGERGGSALRFLKKIGTWMYDLLSLPIDTLVKTVTGKVQVGSSSWKEGFAKQVLQRVDSAKMADEVVNSLKEHLMACHEEFTVEVQKIRNLFERGETIKDDQRKKVLEFAPNLALLEMLAYSVNDKFKFGVPKRGALIGTGAQGSVFVCENLKTPEGKPCVVKVVSVSGEEVLKDLTVELHNTRFIQHSNILPIMCSIVQGAPNGGLTVSTVSEHLKCDLQVGLPAISSLRDRLNIALDVAKALQYLHAQELIHRDVKVQNVLLDNENHAKLTDLGLCKPEGLANSSLVGTPINMAPEMIKQNYGKPIDVYAFGMLLWRVCEGKGNQPQNVHRHMLPLVMLMLNALENKTPERLEVFTESCWELMEKCWRQNPEERPSFDTVVQDMKNILSDPDIK